MSAQLAAHLQEELTFVAFIFLLTRTDGVQFGFTDHDQLLTVDGIDYEPHSGFIPTTTEYSDSLSVDNLDIEAILDDDRLTELDIQGGLYDFATVEYAEVNWADLTMGKAVLKTGTIGEISRNRDTFTAEVRGPSQAMAQIVGEVLTPTCRANLGDSRCKVDIVALTVAGSVTTTESRRVFFDAARTEVNDYFNYGLLTWTSGKNNGRAQEVKLYTLAGGRIELLLRTGFDVAVGDTYQVYPGCDKQFTTCHAKFANVLNFRGEPYIPGQDELARVGGT